MAEEILRSRHAFGDLANVDQALADRKIDAYDILFLKSGKTYTVGWIDKDGNKVILEDKKQVIVVDSLPETGEEEIVYICGSTFYYWDGTKFVTSVAEGSVTETVVEEKITTAITEANAYTDEKFASTVEEANTYTDSKIEDALEAYLSEEYEISHKPNGTIVDYREKEIRVMCPADTEFVLQNSGAGSDPNMYYIGFKAYAPSDDVVNFKEDLLEAIADETMYSFEGNEFAGIEADGRKYSIVWLPVAVYDEASATWTYYGANSSEDKYIGWYYSVEWYNAEGEKVASDCIRVNLTNENCHSSIVPFYVNDAINDVAAEANAYTDKKVAEIASAYEIVEF